MATQYDFVFAGGGMSALLLAYLIRAEAALAHYTILIVEPSGPSAASKHICFWADRLPELPIVLKGKWNKLAFGGSQALKTRTLAPYSYYCFDAAVLQADLLDALKKADGVTFLRDHVERIQDDTLYLQHSPVAYRARQCLYDSLPAPSQQVPLWQHFLGWEIEVANGYQLDTEALTLMDFRVEQQAGPAFMYVLPFSKQKALFEITLMTSDILPADHYEVYLKSYLEEHHPAMEYRLSRTEWGKIPMHQPPTEHTGPKQLRLGIRGGKTKPTTGYTFLNSYQHARQIVARLCGKPTPAADVFQDRFKFYDRLLLSIIRRSPQSVKPIMEALFYKNNYPLLLSFLSEKTSLWQEMPLFFSLPWKPFLTALYREYFHRPARNEAQSGADRPVLYPARLEINRRLEQRVD